MSAGSTWSRERLAAEAARVRELLAPARERPAEALARCLDLLLDEGAAGSLVRRFALVLEALRLHAEHGGLDRRQLLRVGELGGAILRRANIRPTTSAMSHLYGQLHEALSRAHASEGRPWAALWELQISQLLSRRSPASGKGAQLVRAAAHTLRLGHAGTALAQLAVAADEGLEAADALAAAALRARALWLSGNLAAARTLWRQLAEDARVGEEERARSAWDELQCRAGDGDGALALVRAAARGQAHNAGRYLLDAWLWVRAAPSLELAPALPTLKTIRGRLAGEPGWEPGLERLVQCAQTIEQCYDTERPLDQRLRLLRKAMEAAPGVPDVTQELLVLAAGVRWLVRFNQMELAGCVLAEYRALSLRLGGGGMRDDALNLARDLSAEVLLRRYGRSAGEAKADAVPDPAPKEASAVQFYESLSAALRLAGEAGDRQELGTLLASFAARRQVALLKTARVCMLFEEPTAASQDVQVELALKARAAMPPDVVAEQLRSAFGAGPETLFAAWDSVPIAHGTVAQVHRARLHDGREAAVKVQYPEVARAIEADLWRLRALRKVIEPRFPRLDFDAVTVELTDHLLMEVDFGRERAHLEALGAAFRDDPAVVIPWVEARLSSKRVLTMAFVDGQSFGEFAAGASQRERSKAGEIIARMHYSSCFKHGIVHADLAPAHLLFLPGKVAWIDFGRVKRLDPAYMERRRRLARAFFAGDAAGFGAAYTELAGPGAAAPWDAFGRLHAPLLQEGPARFDAAAARAVVAAGAELPLGDGGLLAAYVDLGLAHVLGALEPVADWRRLALPIVTAA